MLVKFEGEISKILAQANFIVHHVTARIHARCPRCPRKDPQWLPHLRSQFIFLMLEWPECRAKCSYRPLQRAKMFIPPASTVKMLIPPDTWLPAAYYALAHNATFPTNLDTKRRVYLERHGSDVTRMNTALATVGWVHFALLWPKLEDMDVDDVYF